MCIRDRLHALYPTSPPGPRPIFWTIGSQKPKFLLWHRMMYTMMLSESQISSSSVEGGRLHALYPTTPPGPRPIFWTKGSQKLKFLLWLPLVHISILSESQIYSSFVEGYKLHANTSGAIHDKWNSDVIGYSGRISTIMLQIHRYALLCAKKWNHPELNNFFIQRF